jgi:hypothetical protein
MIKQVAAVVTVQWNGIADLDFADGGATGIFLSFTNRIDHLLTIAFDATDGSTHSTATQSFASGSQGPDSFVPFSTFSDLGALMSVNVFKATFTRASANWDAGIGYIETRDAPNPGPKCPGPHDHWPDRPAHQPAMHRPRPPQTPGY